MENKPRICFRAFTVCSAFVAPWITECTNSSLLNIFSYTRGSLCLLVRSVSYVCSLQHSHVVFALPGFSFRTMSIVPRVQRLKSIGRSLEKYLKRAHDHAMMMERERVEFERGKRHVGCFSMCPDCRVMLVACRCYFNVLNPIDRS